MKKFLGFSILATALTMSVTSCQNEDIISSSSDETRVVTFKATATVGSDESRTAKPSDANGDLMFQWSENDRVVVFSEDGRRNLGILTLESGAGQSTGLLSGELTVTSSDTKVNIFYMGDAISTDLADLRRSYTLDLSSQNGTNANITDFDIMHSVADVQTMEDGTPYLNFNLESILSFGHFYLNLPEGVSTENDVVVDGKNIMSNVTINFATGALENANEGQINVKPNWAIGAANEGEIFMAFVPAIEVTTSFNVTVDGVPYKADLKERTYTANRLFNGGTAHGKDVYFAENDDWTVTYMDGEEVVETQNANSFAPSMTFTAIAGPEKDAFNFLGWAEAENGDVVYTAGQEFTLNRPVTEKTLYAVWEAAKAENMTVIAWNNDGTTTKQTAVEYNHTWPYTFDLSNFDTPTRENYKFMGWGASADATTAITSVTFEYPETVKEVYAIWDEQWKHTTYTLYYGENGKYGTAQQYYPATGQTPWIFYCEEADYEYTAPAGYELIGWADEENATVADYVYGDKISTGGQKILVKTVYPVLKKKTSEGTITAPGSTGTGY